MADESKSEKTRKTIIDSAFNLFYEHGYKTTSVEQIMKASHLTKGAFYHHYKSKQEIGLEVINFKVQRRLYDAMIAPLEGEGNALTLLETTFINRMRSFTVYEKTHGCAMNNFINEIGDYEQSYQHALKTIIIQWKEALVTLIERGKKAGTIKGTINSEAVAVYLISAFEGIRGIRKLYASDEVIDEYLIGLSMYLNQLSA